VVIGRRSRATAYIFREDGMAKSRPTQLKRQRERAQAEKRNQKAARRLEARARKSSGPRREGDEDPDIAGIRPGPQPSPWEEMGWVDEETETESESERENQ
jgi:hypothetical protein